MSVVSGAPGSTAEIAQAIGKELQAAGHTADVAEVGTVASLAGYNAVVIGGPMYMGRMVGDVGKFVKQHRNDLAKVPVAGFVVGLAKVMKDPERSRLGPGTCPGRWGSEKSRHPKSY